MKEATGELSTTMIAIVAIAAILTVFTLILLPNIRNSIRARMHCADAYACNCSDGKTCKCSYDEYNDDGTYNTTKSVNCDDSANRTTNGTP